MMNPELEDIGQIVDEIFHRSHIRLTPGDIEKILCDRTCYSKKDVRRALRSMVSNGVLQYTNHFNTTHLELSFNRPFEVSKHIVLVPATFGTFYNAKNRLNIFLHQGSAFGVGDHPTTRLCLMGIDWVISSALSKSDLKSIQALDIGTGSGVLAIAAAGLGIPKVLAIDIDPLALHEARKNIELNKLEAKIVLSDKLLENSTDDGFGIMMANLRPPTLGEILPAMILKSDENAIWVLSGFRLEESDGILSNLLQKDGSVLWQEKMCGWTALICKMRSKSEIK